MKRVNSVAYKPGELKYICILIVVVVVAAAVFQPKYKTDGKFVLVLDESKSQYCDASFLLYICIY